LNTGNYQRSKMEFGCVLSMHVNEFRTRFDVMAYLGDMYCELRKPEEALSLLERVIKSTNANSHLEDRHPIRENRNCSISLAALELGRSEESQKWFRIGRNIFDTKSRFWIRGMSTYWREL